MRSHQKRSANFPALSSSIKHTRTHLYYANAETRVVGQTLSDLSTRFRAQLERRFKRPALLRGQYRPGAFRAPATVVAVVPVTWKHQRQSRIERQC